MTQAGGEDRLSKRLTHGAPLAVLLVFGILTAYQLLPVSKVIAVAMLVALVLRTVVDALEEQGTPAWLSVVILLATIIAAVGALVILFIIPSLRSEIHTLLSNGPGSLRSLEKPLHKLPFIPDPSQIMGKLKGSLTTIIGSLPSLVGRTVSLIVAFISAVFLALCLAVSPRTYVSGILRLMPRERRLAVREFIYRVGKRLRGWIFGTAIIASFIGVGGGVEVVTSGRVFAHYLQHPRRIAGCRPFSGFGFGRSFARASGADHLAAEGCRGGGAILCIEPDRGQHLAAEDNGQRSTRARRGDNSLVFGDGNLVGTFLSVPTAVFFERAYR